jgi:general secretion pathway protein L
MPSPNPSAWILIAPHDVAPGAGAAWRAINTLDARDGQGSLADLAAAMMKRDAPSRDKGLTVIAPLSRCVVMATDLPQLTGNKLRLALTGVLQERVAVHAGTQHFAAGPVASDGRITLAAACDAAWLRQCRQELQDVGLAVRRIVPEGALLPVSACWWGSVQANAAPAWLVCAANGEALRVDASLLAAVTPAPGAPEHTHWRWYSDAGATPAGGERATTLTLRQLLSHAASGSWDIRQFSHAAPDRAARIMAWFGSLLSQRAGRFAVVALAAFAAVNIAGLNLYAAKQRRAIEARHAEMESIAAAALPGQPRVLEPALQLEAVWRRSQGAQGSSAQTPAAVQLDALARTGATTALTALHSSERGLRATFAGAAPLQAALAACEGASVKAQLQQHGLRCTSDNGQLLLESAVPAAKG